MAFTQADIDSLDAAIAIGELKVEINGRTVMYRSIAELIQAKNHIAQVLAQTGADGHGKKTYGVAYRFNFKTQRGD